MIKRFLNAIALKKPGHGRNLLFPALYLVTFCSFSQRQTYIYVEGELTDQKHMDDSLTLHQYIREWQQRTISKGHYFSGVDSVRKNENLTEVYLHKGSKWRTRLYSSGYSGKNIKKHLEQQSEVLSNRGYPFAQIKLDSIHIIGDKIHAKLAVQKGPLISYDSVFFFNSIQTDHSYVYHLLEIEPGSIFSEQAYCSIEDKVQRSSFLAVKRPADISFESNKARIYLDLEETTSNTFKGVLGLQTEPSSRKSVIVGGIDLNIENLFRSGKQLHFEWDRFTRNSQELNVLYKHPFFLDSRLSPSFEFGLLKQDSTFISRITAIGLSTFVSNKMAMSFIYKRRSGTLITTQ